MHRMRQTRVECVSEGGVIKAKRYSCQKLGWRKKWRKNFTSSTFCFSDWIGCHLRWKYRRFESPLVFFFNWNMLLVNVKVTVARFLNLQLNLVWPCVVKVYCWRVTARFDYKDPRSNPTNSIEIFKSTSVAQKQHESRVSSKRNVYLYNLGEKVYEKRYKYSWLRLKIKDSNSTSNRKFFSLGA